MTTLYTVFHRNPQNKPQSLGSNKRYQIKYSNIEANPGSRFLLDLRDVRIEFYDERFLLSASLFW